MSDLDFKIYDHPHQLTLPQKQKDPAKTKTLRYKIMFLPVLSILGSDWTYFWVFKHYFKERIKKKNHKTNTEGRNECNKNLIKEGFIGESN